MYRDYLENLAVISKHPREYLSSFLSNKKECPICENRFGCFLPGGICSDQRIIGGGYRKNMYCPRCLSIDRERLLYLFLKENIQDSMRVLHIAPEYRISRFLKRYNIEYFPGDIDKPGVSFLDITNIDHDSDYFDIIICCHVLEYVPDDRKAMKELFRVLKPKGQAILQVPISYVAETFEDTTIQTPEARLAAYGQTDHVRLYGSDYSDKLKSVGFKVNYFKNLNKNDNYGLIKDEKLFISSKE